MKGFNMNLVRENIKVKKCIKTWLKTRWATGAPLMDIESILVLFGVLWVHFQPLLARFSVLRSSQKTSTVLLRDLHKYRSTVLVTKTVLVTILLVIEALVLHKKFYYYILHTHMRSLKLAKKTKMFLGLCDEHLRLNENYATMFDFR